MAQPQRLPATLALATRFQTLPLLMILLVLGGVVRVALAWRDIDALDALFFPDDTYLSLTIAHNIARGLGSTFDGVVATNGYQPLYVWLAVPLYWLFPNDQVLPINFALTLLAIASLGTAVCIFRIVQHLHSSWHAAIACVIWLFDSALTRHALNGLETSLALLGIAATSLWYISRIRGREQIALRDVVVLGMVAGVTVLARVDQVILLAALALDMLLDHRTRRRLVEIGLVGGIVVLLNLPWMLFGMSIGAGPLPESGAAVRMLAMAQATSPQYFISALIVWLSLLLSAPLSSGALVCAVLLVVIVRRFRGQPNHWLWESMQRLRPLRFAGIFALLFSAAYLLYIPAYWFFDRYAQPVAFFALVASAVFLPAPGVLSTQARRWFVGVTTVFLAFEVARGATLLVAQPAPDNYLGIGRWVNANLAGHTVGALQSGAIGYWGEGITVVNLDGVVDGNALAARRSGDLAGYMRQRGVEYVVEWSPTFGKPGDGDLSGVTYIAPIPNVQSWGSQWHVFSFTP